MTRTFYNSKKDITVRFTGESFVVIGDDSKVSDAELLSMAKGIAPEGWEETAGR